MTPKASGPGGVRIRYDSGMRARWPEWVIVISLVVIGLTGVAAIWGGDLKRLVVDVSRGGEVEAPEPTGGAQPAAPATPDLPPGGPPAGPF